MQFYLNNESWCSSYEFITNQLESLEQNVVVLNQNSNEYLQILKYGTDYLIELRSKGLGDKTYHYRIGKLPSSSALVFINSNYGMINAKKSEILKISDLNFTLKKYYYLEYEFGKEYYKRNITKEIGL